MLTHKTTQFFFGAIKLLIAIGVICFVIYRVSEQDIHFGGILNQLDSTPLFSGIFLGIALLFTTINWLLEIKKWQLLSGVVHSYTFAQTAFIALVGHAASIITPLKAGEYSTKAYYAKASQRKKIAFLTFYGNVLQMSVTIFFGILGSLIFTYCYLYDYFIYVILSVGILIVALFFVQQLLWKLAIQFKRFSFTAIQGFFSSISKKTSQKALALSFLRYIVFAHQFYFLLLVFQVDLPYFLMMGGIGLMYFLSSITPILSLFDVVLKVGIAWSIFTFMGADEVPIIYATTFMWFLNFIFPAVLGSVLLAGSTVSITSLKTYP